CRCAWHRARAWRHNDRRIRMTLADLMIDIVPIVRAIAGKRRNRARNLLQQGTDLRAVIDFLAGQLGGDDLSGVGVHPDMELSPGPTHLCGVLLDQPLTSRPTNGAFWSGHTPISSMNWSAGRPSAPTMSISSSSSREV